MDVKKNIRRCREECGLSQEYVALKMGMSQQAYQQMEAGTTKLDAHLMPNLAVVLNTTLYRLYGIEKNPDSHPSNAIGLTEQQLYQKLIDAQALIISSKDHIIELQGALIANGKGRKK